MPASKVEFLVAFHTLLVGDHAGTGGQRALAGLERTLLARGIQAVYRRCAASGERPREQLLHTNSCCASRATRQPTRPTVTPAWPPSCGGSPPAWERYIAGGPASWMADDATTLAPGAPLLLFNLAGLPDALAGPVMLTLVDFIDRDVQARRARHLAAPLGQTARTRPSVRDNTRRPASGTAPQSGVGLASMRTTPVGRGRCVPGPRYQSCAIPTARSGQSYVFLLR